MSDENLERRVTAVEAEVAEVRREAAAARAPASGADRDVADYRAEMRAHTRGLEALRQTQLEHHAEHKGDLADFRAGVETRFAEVNAGLRAIVGLLQKPGGPAASRAE